MSTLEQRVFKQGSTTYYWSSKFFPKAVRGDVFKLYSFVRVIDDYVDEVPQHVARFERQRKTWRRALTVPQFDAQPHRTDTLDTRVIKNMVALNRTYHFDPAWVEAFWDSMQADLQPKPYPKLADSLRYVYGSAEVIGLMMSTIMDLPSKAYKAARMQGRAMQWINFIRDIAEDTAVGRCYFPQEDLKRFGLKDLHEKTARAHPDRFQEFIGFQIARYRRWQTAAEAGYHYIPRRLRTPLRTAAQMYNWTAAEIAKDPLMVFDGKVKPSAFRVTHNAVLASFQR